jgi:regulator of replication initiation timing
MVFVATSFPVLAQETLQDSIQSLQKQTSELKAMLEEMKAEMVRSHTETMALRQELEATREQLAAVVPVPQAGESPAVQRLEEDQQLLSAKVDDQYQTKVESASKYRVRLSGTVLMNLFSNNGFVDNIDFPSFVGQYGTQYSRGSFGGTLRQSQIGLEAFGPQIKGARVSADVQFDFAGGFPSTPDGTTLGLPRLRTGAVRLTWPRTTIVAGQDAPFFSPRSPTSVATLALPEFAYSGNLWTWIPQARLERRLDLSESSSVLLQGGILDPLTGELPSSQFLRTAGAGEASRQPAYAARTAWSRKAFGQTLTAGIGGYYSRQAWGPYRNVDAWAGTADWTVPLSNRWELSGESYRGRAIGGLGGGFGHSVGYSGPVSSLSTQIGGLNSAGGWAQAKFRQTERLEWNGGFGQDTILAGDLRRFPVVQQGYIDPTVARNQAAFINLIYRPRSDFLFSVEYRHLRTFGISGNSAGADHINVGMGVLF